MASNETGWNYRDDAACKGMVETEGPIFWSNIPADIERAMAICGRCTVSHDCDADRGATFDDLLFVRGGVRG